MFNLIFIGKLGQLCRVQLQGPRQKYRTKLALSTRNEAEILWRLHTYIEMGNFPTYLTQKAVILMPNFC